MNITHSSRNPISGFQRSLYSTVLAALFLLAGFWMPPQSASASNPPASSFSGSASLTALEEPTVVWVAQFQAERQSGGEVQLSWMTAIEMNMIGFYLYREDPRIVQSEPINPNLIMATQSGELIGDDYTFVDASAEPGTIGNYWLEVVRAASEPLIIGPAEKATPEIKLYLPVMVSHTP